MSSASRPSELALRSRSRSARSSTELVTDSIVSEYPLTNRPAHFCRVRLVLLSRRAEINRLLNQQSGHPHYLYSTTDRVDIPPPLPTMSTLEGKKVVVVGGSSGIGYAVVKAALLALADHVTVASSSPSKVDTAVRGLLAEPVLQMHKDLVNRVSGKVLDIKNLEAVREFFEKLGEIDHLVITAGTHGGLRGDFKEKDIDKLKGRSPRYDFES